MLVDARWPNNERRILRKLDRAGIDRDSISLLLLTHSHGDHAGSAAALVEILDVPVAIGAPDAADIAGGNTEHILPTGGTGKLLKPLIRRHFPPITADIEIDSELDLQDYGVEAIAAITAGHTPGSLIIRWGDHAIIGDLIRGGMSAKKRPKLHFFHQSTAIAHEELDHLIADGVQTILPSHGGPLDAEAVREFLEDH